MNKKGENMQIRPMMRKIVLCATTIAATACHEARGPLQKITAKDHIDTELVHFLSKQTQDVLKDTTRSLYARDTIQIQSPLRLNTNKFKEDVAIASGVKIPKVLTGTRPTQNFIGNPSDKEILIYTNKFIEPEAFVKNELFQSKNGDIFVPVEFYGKKNPDPILKKFEN